MLTLVPTVQDLARNVREYQEPIRRRSSRITTSLVRHWYYIPALDMVGASRFIGYKDMTVERYDQSEEVNGKITQPHLQEKGWFRQLEPGEPDFIRAYDLAASLDRLGRVFPHARFYTLKSNYDKQIRV